ncbi:MAG TPA: DUF2087 domain-containing protein [Candidatus Wallbacteria bacterium]|nr:DUF2087 domain-containing protein [Candidatus Wallbacteria bacterium]
MKTENFIFDFPVEIIARGYAYNEARTEYICMFCRTRFVKGMIYKEGNNFYDAEKAASIHIEKKHFSVLKKLLEFDPDTLGVTARQKEALLMFADKRSDNEIADKMGCSESTIRQYRFNFREKERQARAFLTLMKLSGLNSKEPELNFIPIPEEANFVDGRYNITVEENEKVLDAYFPEGREGVLKQLPVKEKKKLIILRHIVKRFERGVRYSEKQVNEILKSVFDKHVIIRRLLIDYGFMSRLKDGSEYWLS